MRPTEKRPCAAIAIRSTTANVSLERASRTRPAGHVLHHPPPNFGKLGEDAGHKRMTRTRPGLGVGVGRQPHLVTLRRCLPSWSSGTTDVARPSAISVPLWRRAGTGRFVLRSVLQCGSASDLEPVGRALFAYERVRDPETAASFTPAMPAARPVSCALRPVGEHPGRHNAALRPNRLCCGLWLRCLSTCRRSRMACSSSQGAAH